MEAEQELEWKNAQSIAVSVDLAAAAKRQLQFLAAVDRNRWLYEGPALEFAIHRYNVYWLPLLAKHSESPCFDGPLVVPLDCEWVWHCHRLNPVRYKSDCEELYGRILDNHNVVSSVEGISMAETENLWKTLYPDVSYDLDSTKAQSYTTSKNPSGVVKCTKCDLTSAVKRQSTFFYQVARPHMSHDLFLEVAVARYKGFLHIIKRNKERSIRSFMVPTYDIDLIWHTHQLHPASYCKDLVELMDKVLEHDDTDSDRSKGKKLDLSFSGTTNQWEEMYGLRYWRAGAMHRGNAPSPLRTTPYPSLNMINKDCRLKENPKVMHLPETKVVEVMLEFVGVKNLPEGHKGRLFVSFNKTQPDTIFNVKRSLTIFSESGEKQVACFLCEPSGHLFFELMQYSDSRSPIAMAAKSMCSASVALEDLLSPSSNLTMEKWLEVVPSSKSRNSKPLYLRVAISVTLPTSAPHVFHMVHSRPFSKNSCFFPLAGRIHLMKHWTRFIDDSGNEIISLQMRDSKKSKGENDGMLRKEVIGIVKSGGTRMFAEFTGIEWLLIGSNWSLKLPGKSDSDGYFLELIGDHSVKFFSGRRLDYELKHCEQHNNNKFLTGVEFSPENPYGKAVALLDLTSGTIKVNEEWLLFPGLVLTFILVEILRKEGYDNLIASGKNLEGKRCSGEEVYGCDKAVGKTISTTSQVRTLDFQVSQGNAVVPEKGGACGGACNGSCGNGHGIDGKKSGSTLSSGGCGGCGGGCGNMIKNEGRGGGCGGSGGCGNGCGNKISKECSVDASACGGGCGGGCGAKISGGHRVDALAGSGGCGSGCGTKISGDYCDDAVAGGGGCGSGCGGGCGNKISGGHHIDSVTGGGGCGSGCGGGCGNKQVVQ